MEELINKSKEIVPDRNIKNLRKDDRPREKLLSKGVSALSDADILAILIRNGTKGFSAIDAARELLRKHKNLTNLSVVDFSGLKQVKGLGNTKAVTLIAAFDLARRMQAEPFINKKKITKPDNIANIYIPKFRGVTIEVFKTILLNSANHIIRDITISQGSLNASIVHAREVFKVAISESAASIILLHNHPSGNPEPSKEDIEITSQLIKAGEIIGIKVVDHIIIAGEDYQSFVEIGLI